MSPAKWPNSRILWILTVTNALNLSDNMNGLCAGLAAIAAFYLASFAARHGQYLVAAFGCVLLGVLLVLAISLLDVAQVTLHRTLTGQPFWIGDTNHLSHRLARTRLGKTGAVVVLWILAALVGGLTWVGA